MRSSKPEARRGAGPGTGPLAAVYRTFRDSAIFTTKRMVVRDAQGITGKKVDVRRLDMLIRHSSSDRRTNLGKIETAGGLPTAVSGLGAGSRPQLSTLSVPDADRYDES